MLKSKSCCNSMADCSISASALNIALDEVNCGAANANECIQDMTTHNDMHIDLLITYLT